MSLAGRAAVDLQTCYGWAYEPCGAAAVWVIREQSLTSRYWGEYGVCKEHAHMIVDAAGSETDEYRRTWVPLAYWDEFTRRRSAKPED